MAQAVAARIPECGEFAGIAQDLSYAIDEIAPPVRSIQQSNTILATESRSTIRYGVQYTFVTHLGPFTDSIVGITEVNNVQMLIFDLEGTIAPETLNLIWISER